MTMLLHYLNKKKKRRNIKIEKKTHKTTNTKLRKFKETNNIAEEQKITNKAYNK